MKKLFKPLGILLVLILLLGIIVNITIRRQLKPDKLKALLEEEISATVTLGDVKLTPWLFPNRLSLHDVTLALSGTPSGQIPSNFPSAIQAQEIALAVKFLPLLKKELNIKEFTLKNPSLSFVLYQNGGNSLEDLFEEPFNAQKEKSKEDEKADDLDDKKADKESESLDLSRYGGFIARLESAQLEHAQAQIYLEESKSTITVENLNLKLHDIAVDLGAIEKTNHAELDLSGKFSFQSPQKNLPPYFGIHLSGPAKVRLFDPKSKELAPDVQARFTISEDSYLDTRIPALQKVMAQVRKLEKLGLTIKELPEKASFGRAGEQRELAVQYQNGLVTLNESLSVLYGDWELQLSPESWVHAQSESEENHHLKARLLANAGLSQSLQKRLTQIDKYLPKELRGEQGSLANDLFTQDRLNLKISSKGDLSSPKVRLDHQLPELPSLSGLSELPALEKLNLQDLDKDELKKELKKKAKEKAKDLLKGLFN